MLTEDLDEVGPVLRGLRVMIAEDNWTLAEAMRGHIERVGGRVSAMVPSVAEGTAALGRHSVDVLVADMNLRDGMADRLIEAAFETGARIVVVTGYGALPSDSDHLVDVRIQKPVRPGELIEVIRLLAWQK